ncbi:NAD(P)-dependent dehydrogenase, short-chain alcohol dehydrogenase family [Geopseudomonas sagittaria]|uniref:NAD(P)-dependent dehydrogenase, short-chain alcohol dehydrogenase family n=1 Tax=Geopseudomonas sagittaria TaxID=1135990 RepID=A0A1I5R1A7_9GAMM|nr:SDR family oxidoreductase [Pseudomonas sagittaria]SFP52292.1 NAD(P)-dependent dehydrogenase, short-chain alcohol dehydrogenase family [Pseudomonas sagittaria]
MATQNLDFAGKVVLVTGGTKGVGAGIAQSFLAAGARVLVCGRNAPETLPAADGRQAEFLTADVRDADSLATLFAVIEERCGRLDVLVNNAGGSPHVLADEASPRFHEGIIRLNLIAPLNVAQHANRLMQRQEQGGVIVFIGSISALRPSPGTAAYGAAKAGVLALVTSLAVEWAPKVRVVTVSPGLVRTEQAHLHYGDEQGIAAVGATIPAGRMASPEDIGNACLYIASPLAGYASGCNLLLHGGGERPAFLSAANSAHQ